MGSGNPGGASVLGIRPDRPGHRPAGRTRTRGAGAAKDPVPGYGTQSGPAGQGGFSADPFPETPAALTNPQC